MFQRKEKTQFEASLKKRNISIQRKTEKRRNEIWIRWTMTQFHLIKKQTGNPENMPIILTNNNNIMKIKNYFPLDFRKFQFEGALVLLRHCFTLLCILLRLFRRFLRLNIL